MIKYSEEFKLKIVTKYLNGNLVNRLLEKKYCIPSISPIRNWIRTYKHHGIEGLKRRIKYILFNSVQFKLNAKKFILETGLLFPEIAEQFKMNNPLLVFPWSKKFEEERVEGL